MITWARPSARHWGCQGILTTHCPAHPGIQCGSLLPQSKLKPETRSGRLPAVCHRPTFSVSASMLPFLRYSSPIHISKSRLSSHKHPNYGHEEKTSVFLLNMPHYLKLEKRRQAIWYSPCSASRHNCVIGASETIATTSHALEQQQVTRHAVGKSNRTPASCLPADQELT